MSSNVSHWYDFIKRNKPVEVEKKGGDALRDIPLPFDSYVSMVGCYTPDTEVFTDSGWKRADKITGTEKVYSIDPDTGKADFYPIKEKYEYDYTGAMYAVGGKDGLLLSPEHKMLGFTASGGKPFKFAIKDIYSAKRGYFKKKAVWIGGTVPKDFTYAKYQGNRWGKIKVKSTHVVKAKDWFDFLGWFVSEGHLDKYGYGVRITQYKPDGKAKIEDMLNRCGFTYSKLKQPRDGVVYAIKSKSIYTWLQQNCYDGNGYHSTNKVIPREVLSSTEEYAKVFLQSYLDGDGHLTKYGTYVASTNSSKLAVQLDELGLKLGYDTHSNVQHSTHTFMHVNGMATTGVYTQYVIAFKSNYAGMDIRSVKKELEIIPYSGKIYDINVEPYHTIFIRRNNITLFTGNSNEKTPLYRWSYRWLADMYYGSDLLRTIIKTITDEAFKHNFRISEKFKMKCYKCGYESFADIDTCPVCGGPMRSPDLSQREILEDFLKKRNRFNEDIITTMKTADTDLNIFDNAFILMTKKYMYNSGGRIVGAEIVDLVRLAPDKIKLVMSNYGFGRDDVGRYAYFCPEHREAIIVKSEPDDDYRCPTCNRQMLPAWFASSNSGSGGGSTTGQLIYYGADEVLHLKRWSNTSGYGVSPLYSVWRKVLTLLKIDEMIMEAYSLERSPKALLVIRGKVDNIRAGFQWISQKARENPNMVWPLVIEGEENGAKRLVEKVDFNLKPAEMEMMDMIEKYRQYVGLVYGVSPIFSEGASGQGLQNEGLQITVTNRTITETQRVWNMFLKWVSDHLGVSDYIIELYENEMQDEMSKLELEKQRVQIAKTIASLGFDVDITTDERGVLEFTYKKLENEQAAKNNGGGDFTPEFEDALTQAGNPPNVGGGGGAATVKPPAEEPAVNEQPEGGEQ